MISITLMGCAISQFTSESRAYFLYHMSQRGTIEVKAYNNISSVEESCIVPELDITNEKSNTIVPSPTPANESGALPIQGVHQSS